MTYCQLGSYLLATYARADVFAMAEADITHFKQLKGGPAVRYSEMAWKTYSAIAVYTMSHVLSEISSKNYVNPFTYQ